MIEPTESRDEDGFGCDACLSIAGEDRSHVSMVADCLRSRGVRVFRHDHEQVPRERGEVTREQPARWMTQARLAARLARPSRRQSSAEPGR